MASMQSPAASPSLSPSPPPTPAPTIPPDLARVAVASRGAIRVRIELERNPLPAGEPSWVTVTVTNRGSELVTWYHDGCAMAATSYGTSDVAWEMGVDPATDRAAMFKTYALGGSIAASPKPRGTIQFVPEAFLATGLPGCADIGIADTIEPGERIRQTHWWSGFTDKNRAVPPAGPVTIRSYVAFFWEGSQEPERITDHAIELEIDAWITDHGGPDRLSPAQVVDAALADPEFAAYVDTQDIPSGRAEITWYDPDREVWEVGVMPWYATDPPRIRGVLVDPFTGKVLSPLDRPWDPDVDGWP